jgi:hypothetical protein
MRTTVDIPDPLYRQLKSAAAIQGCSVKELVLRGVKAELQSRRRNRKSRPAKLPIIPSEKPGWLRLNNRRINEILLP